jgi:hypothetical protein
MGPKDTGFRIRVERDLRDAFLEACRAQDKPAAQVIREFMRRCVARHRGGSGVSPSSVPQAGSTKRR